MNTLGPEYRIKSSKTEYYFILFISVLGAIAIFKYVMDHQAFSTKTSNSGNFVLFLTIHYLFVVPFVILRLFISKPYLLINSDGIYCRKHSTLPKKRIKWETFESFSLGQKSGRPYIEFKLKNKKYFFMEFPKYESAIAAGFEDELFPLGIYPEKLGVDKEELMRQIGVWLPRGKSENKIQAT